MSIFKEILLTSFQKNVHATRFVEYVCLQVLPVLSEIGAAATDSEVQLELLKLLAEMSGHCGELSAVERCTANVYDCLQVSLLLLWRRFLAKISRYCRVWLPFSFCRYYTQFCLWFLVLKSCSAVLKPILSSRRLS